MQRVALAKCRVERWRGPGFDDADVSIAPPKIPYGGFSPVRLQGQRVRRGLPSQRPGEACARIPRSTDTFTPPFAHVHHRAAAWLCVQDKPAPSVSRCTRGPASLPQGSLAPAGVVLSPALIAYYDPIRQSRGHAAISPPCGLYAAPSLCRHAEATHETFPTFTAALSTRAVDHTPVGPSRAPVTLAARYQASSTSQRVATHEYPSLPAIPDGVKHFGAASFASCCGPYVYLALLTGYDAVRPRAPHRAFAELCHSRLVRKTSPPPGESQARWANGKPPIVGTCTRQVTAASEAAREARFKSTGRWARGARVPRSRSGRPRPARNREL